MRRVPRLDRALSVVHAQQLLGVRARLTGLHFELSTRLRPLRIMPTLPHQALCRRERSPFTVWTPRRYPGRSVPTLRAPP